MRPTVWGPPLWQAMFACAWNCPADDFPILHALLLHQIPKLLPCELCRNHFVSHLPYANRRARGEPQSPQHAFRWLYYLKDEVNRSIAMGMLDRARLPSEQIRVIERYLTSRLSPSFLDITERYVLHGGVVDEVALGDVLVLMALTARQLKLDDVFVATCRSLATLLPLPHDSQFRQALARLEGPVVTSAVDAARRARVERGLRTMTLAHYRNVAQ